MKIDLIVTRHTSLVDYVKELGLAGDDVEVISHASPEAIKGKNVLGVLPHSLSCLCESFTEIPLVLPPELRGQELSVEQIREFAREPATYRVVKL